jgi:uncharacterized membrane protein
VRDKLSGIKTFKQSGAFSLFGIIIIIMAANLAWYLIPLFRKLLLPNSSTYNNLKSFFRMRTLFLAYTCLFMIVYISYAIGIQFDLVKVIFILAMIFLVAMGNYYPTLRYNFLFGIRNPWTQSSEEIWKKTHRFAGKVYFWGGLAGALFGILYKSKYFPSKLILFSLVLIFLPRIYSYILYRRIKSPELVKNIKYKNYLFIILSSLLVIIGAFFKVFHYPGSSLLFSIGFLLGIISLIFHFRS